MSKWVGLVLLAAIGAAVVISVAAMSTGVDSALITSCIGIVATALGIVAGIALAGRAGRNGRGRQ